MRIYNKQELPRFRHVYVQLRINDHSVDDDLFNLGLGCQMGYYWMVRWNSKVDVKKILIFKKKK